MGSTRVGRNGDRVGKFYVNQMKARGSMNEVDYVDLAHVSLGLMENPVAYLPADKISPELKDLA